MKKNSLIFLFALDILHFSICLLKWIFLASLLPNFSIICMHMLSKFVKKAIQKSLIFSCKANYAKSLLITLLFFQEIELLAVLSTSAESTQPLPSTQKIRKTVCLNMIVKNESQVIERCLNSLKKHIDYWVIFDTGSTDNTKEIIRHCMKGIPGELHESNWVNFKHNRNEALMAAKGKGDYLLMIDADEIWVYPEDFTLPDLDMDSYYINVRALGSVDFKRIALANNHLNWHWEGVLHECLECPEATRSAVLLGVVNICNADIENAKGGRAKDHKATLRRDAATLEKALEAEPNNTRYIYYLAQSYAAIGELELAQEYYDKRSCMPSADVQETYAALYYSGVMSEKLKNTDAALRKFFKAHAFRPTRAEPLVQAAKIYRKQENFLLGYLLTQYALTLPAPVTDLCYEYTTYDHIACIEFANCALLLGKNREGLEACQKLLANPNLPPEIRPQVVSNYNLAQTRLKNSGQMGK